ncbi:hypothetical protein GGI20_006264, partial [Coemansia sp. BCRC 34301]
MSASSVIQHPYYPQDVPIPHYVVSKLDMSQALLTLGSAIAGIVVVSGLLIGRARNTLSSKDRLIFVWML